MPQQNNNNTWAKSLRINWQLYLILLIPVAYIIIFKYVPMYGAQIAFRNYSARKGFFGSPWVGFYHFQRFFSSYQFWRVIKNTLGISVYLLVAGFPIPIILALSLNSTNIYRLKKTVQTATYIPHFISTVVMVGMLLQFLSPRVGIINTIRGFFGGDPVNYIAVPEYFRGLYVWSAVWQHAGWSSIIYIAALSAVDPALHEAALIDGASKFQRVIHLDFPSILPTAIILLIMNAGRMMNVGFEKVFLMQNDLNLRVSEVIQTYVYKVGLQGASANFSYSTAIGLFNSVVNFILIVSVNQLSKRLSSTSLW